MLLKIYVIVHFDLCEEHSSRTSFFSLLSFDWWQMFSVYNTFLYMLVPYVTITYITLYESYEKFAEIRLFNKNTLKK